MAQKKKQQTHCTSSLPFFSLWMKTVNSGRKNMIDEVWFSNHMLLLKFRSYFYFIRIKNTSNMMSFRGNSKISFIICLCIKDKIRRNHANLFSMSKQQNEERAKRNLQFVISHLVCDILDCLNVWMGKIYLVITNDICLRMPLPCFHHLFFLSFFGYTF